MLFRMVNIIIQHNSYEKSEKFSVLHQFSKSIQRYNVQKSSFLGAAMS